MRLPLIVLQLTKENESAVAIDVDRDASDRESLRDRRLHLPDAATFAEVDIGQCATFPMCDEIAVRAALDRNLDEFVDGETAGPRCRRSVTR